MSRWKDIIWSNSPNEFFKSTSKDLSIIIKITIQKQREDIREALKNFTYFKDWDEQTIEQCTHLSKIREFNGQTTIYGDRKGENSYAYFILEGKCCVIDLLNMLVKYDSYGHKSYTLFETEDEAQNALKLRSKKIIDNVFGNLHIKRKKTTNKREHNKDVDKVITRFVQSYFLNEGACFGLDGLPSHRRIVAMTPVKLLLIPSYWLLAHNEANIWNRMLRFLVHKIPTKERVFERYVADRTWRSHREKLCYKCTGRNENTKHLFARVPYSIRVVEQYESE